MAGVKITTFLGKAPKVSPELLPNTAAQIAENCKLYSGDLIPFPNPVVVDNTQRSGLLRTLYALRDPNNGTLKWLSWNTEVNIAVASANLQDEQRFYYSGDGAPKVSNYELATTGAAPYPVGFYDLGLPIPPDSATLTTTAASFTTKNTSSFARDAGNIATIVTSIPHGLRTGNNITVAGFTFRTGTYNQPGGTTITVTINNHGLSNGASVTLDFTSGAAIDGTFTITNVTTNTFDVTAGTAATTNGDVRLDIRGFNATNVECTVVNSTTFTYFSPGFEIATTSYTDGRVDLSGLTQARSYVFTWFTPWSEESIASKPSDNLFIKEGVQVTVTNIPTIKPPGNNFVRGVRLYRTLPSISGTEYFRLATLWFPTAVTFVQRTAGVSRVTLQFPHNLDPDDRFKISGCQDATFDITDGVVTDVVDDYTFEYTQAGANVSPTAVITGTLFHDVAETLDKPARYWGDAGNFDFVDDFDSRLLLRTLESDEYDPPPADLKGLTTIQNNVLVGFVGNTLYFSEPALLHAWPNRYATPVSDDIVALAATSGSLLVLTKSYPFIVTVNDPANGISVARVDTLLPCLSARSVVTMEYGIVWSTNDGLAVYSPTVGATLVTKVLYNNDTWRVDVDPNTVVASFYGETYFASHSAGSFVFEQDAKVGGFFVDTSPVFTAAWYDTHNGVLYYAAEELGDVYQWNNLAQPNDTMTWKSKVIVTKNMINLGAARVIADYDELTVVWGQYNVAWENANIFWNGANAVTFSLWVDKQLTYTTMVTDDASFRLPTGYRTDTFEVGVSGNVRVRAIHLAETPYGLREV